jgi:hypothetical protein
LGSNFKLLLIWILLPIFNHFRCKCSLRFLPLEVWKFGKRIVLMCLIKDLQTRNWSNLIQAAFCLFILAVWK